ncbi:MAG: terminase small subunit, partial [Candidatus Brocadiia bacterium]
MARRHKRQENGMDSRHKDKHGLTPKQAMAVEHYILHGCMSDAYRHAYSTANMKPATVNRRAIELFAKPHVASRVQALREENDRLCQLTRKEALAILARIARGELSQYLDKEGHIRPELIHQGGPELESYTEKQHVQSGDEDMIVLSRKLKIRDPIRAIK